MPDDDEAAAAAAALRRATRSTGPARRPRSTTRAASGSTSPRDPQPIGNVVDEVIRDQGWKERSQVAVVLAEWARIVGPELADHVRPETFDDGELVVRAESTAWATQVRLLLPQVQAAVDQEVGRGVVRRIVVQGPQGPTWTAGKRRVKGRGPRDTYG